MPPVVGIASARRGFPGGIQGIERMTGSKPPTEKQRLRRSMRPLLERVTPSQAQAAGASIAERLVQSDFWRVASRVVVFASQPDEVDMSTVQRRSLDEAKPVLLPRMAATGSLEFAALGRPGALREGRFGILEPPLASPALGLSPDDLVLVPGLAFDRNGGRLGRGRGYYDRALEIDREAEFRPLLIGVGFSFQLVERVPMGVLDVRLDGLVCELELYESDGLRQWLARKRRRIGRLD